MKPSMIAVLLAAMPIAAAAQDAVTVDPAHYKVLVDNAVVRVLKVDYAVGEKSVMHAHPDAMLVPLAPGNARFTMPDGRTQDMDVKTETVAYTPATTHLPANLGPGKIDALLVEFKGKEGGGRMPTARPGMTQTVLAESPRATAWRTTATPAFHEAAGTTHEYDQVVIALGASDVKVAVEGQSARTHWERGDVLFIGRGVKHESQNTSGKPVDFVIVGIK